VLLILCLLVDLDHLAPTVGATAFTDAMRSHQLAALRAGNQRWRVEALMLAAVAAAMA